MDRKKPALTAPWKVGFLVALLLVVTSIGVAYFITGTFGVTWHWLEMNGPSPAQWSFNPGAFLEEMAPLVALTSLLAFGAFVLVAGAVRRYKNQTDNGADYRQLLKSIKSVEDLEDEEVLDQLKKHPELREFVLGIKNRVAAFERQQGERDRRVPEAGGNGRRAQDSPTLGAECAVLASAAINGRDGFSRELALTIPELKQIERAVRQAFAATVPAPAAPASDGARAELESLRAKVRGAAVSVRRDANACAAGAREVEEMLASLRQTLGSVTGAATPVADASALLSQVDATASALGALGEETRRIAIASALQASGGADNDAIRVADEVRAIATRFNSVAQQWKQLAPALRTALERNAGAGSGTRERAAMIAALGTVANKAGLWGERAVAMGEQVRAFERAAGIDSGAEAPVARPEPAPAVESGPSPAVSWAAEPGDITAPAAVETTAGFDDPSTVSLADDGSDFVNPSVASVFESAAVSDEEARFAEIPGFEKEHRFFAESENVDARQDVAVHIDVEHHDEAPAGAAAGAGSVDELADAPEAPEATTPPDGFLTGPRAEPEPIVDADRVEVARPAPRPRLHPAGGAAAPAAGTATATLEPDVPAAPVVEADADAVDLYALGAVDYEDA